MNLEGYKAGTKVSLSAKDKKTLKDFQKIVKGITKDMDDFKFYIAAEKIYHYFWHTFCDKIIEEQKVRLNGENIKEKQASQYLLLAILADCLKTLHPFMPFVTEEIYQQLPNPPAGGKQKYLMVESWPK
jgi:valyl-tRNA synthetase